MLNLDKIESDGEDANADIVEDQMDKAFESLMDKPS
jgi:hypothetical protein